MALLKYLKPKKKLGEELLPDPEGSLSEHLSSEAIREANKEVKHMALLKYFKPKKKPGEELFRIQKDP